MRSGRARACSEVVDVWWETEGPLLENQLEADLATSGALQPFAQEVDSRQESLIQNAAKKFEAATNGEDCLVVVARLDQGPARESVEDRIMRACIDRFGYPAAQADRTINVVLESPGGSADSAFKSSLFLSHFASTINVFVPRYAKSAATLLALGADDILMSPFAELGPLDAQIRDPRNPAETISALDCYQSVDYVREFGLQTLVKALWLLVGQTQARIPLGELVNTASDFSLKSIGPMIAQVKALDFGAWGRSLKIGEMYAQRLLRRTGAEQYEAERIARQLVYDYTHHPFPIDLTEATKVGLNARAMSPNQYEASLAIVQACNNRTFVGFPATKQRAALKRKVPVEVPGDTGTLPNGRPRRRTKVRDADQVAGS